MNNEYNQNNWIIIDFTKSSNILSDPLLYVNNNNNEYYTLTLINDNYVLYNQLTDKEYDFIKENENYNLYQLSDNWIGPIKNILWNKRKIIFN